MLTDHWTRADFHRDYCVELLEIFRRAGYVSDTGRTFAGPVVVYRGNLGEDPRIGICWTLSRAKARWFALRASLMGLQRADGIASRPTVWKAIVEGEALLGYFFRRGEAEVVVDPASVDEPAVFSRPRGRVDF